MTRELFPRDHRDHAEDDEDDLTLPDPGHVRSEVPSAPNPDLTPSHTKDVEPPPGTDEPADG
ncbi:hypothetical protein ACWEOE_17510 [Amycolatopsis sp. NPDC004368]